MRDTVRFFSKNKLQVVSTLLALIISFLTIVLTVVLYHYMDNAKNNLENKVQIAVFVEKPIKDDEDYKLKIKNTLVDKITKIDNVKKVRYKDADEELDNLIKDVSGGSEVGETFEDIKEDNPLQDVIYVDVSNKSKIDITSKDISKLSQVSKVEYNKSASQIYLKSLKLMLYGALASILVTVALTFPNLLMLINSGIRMRKTELRIKKLVGASRLKIMGNFIIETLILFLVSFIITFIISKFIIDLIHDTVEQLGLKFLELNNTFDVMLNANIIVWVIGMLLAVFSVWYALYINRNYN